MLIAALPSQPLGQADSPVLVNPRPPLKGIEAQLEAARAGGSRWQLALDDPSLHPTTLPLLLSTLPKWPCPAATAKRTRRLTLTLTLFFSEQTWDRYG